MVKKWSALSAIIVFIALVIISSCAKDKADKQQPVSCSGISADSNTYNLKIKAILDFNCAYSGCHDVATQVNLSVDLSNYAAAKSAFQTQDVFCCLNHGTTGCNPMPQGLPKLADSLIAYMQCWADNGYAQ